MKLDLDAQHIKACYDTLKEQKCLFALPRPTLKALSEKLGDSFTKDLGQEFERLLVVEQPSRYLEDEVWPVAELVGPDLKFLSELPGGWEKALSLFIHCAEVELGYQVESGNQYAWKSETEIWDSLAMAIASNGIRLCLPLQRAKRASSTIQALRKHKADISLRVWANRCEKKRCSARAKIYQKSLLYFYDTHSAIVGNMLSLKVTGHLLPPELVALIAECWREGRTPQDYDVEITHGYDDEARDTSDDESESKEETESEATS